MYNQCAIILVVVAVYTNCQISLEYKPMRPFYHPRPSGTHIRPIVPPGKPLPDRPTEVVDRIKGSEETATKETFATTPAGNQSIVNNRVKEEDANTTSLEYKPNRPPFHPNPGNNIGQIIPPGKPWPSNQEGYQNYSQITPNLEDRIKEDKTESSVTSKETEKPTSINIEYKPNRPFFHPKPGNVLSQIVPPGKPWPSNVDGYQNFSSSSSKNLTNRVKEESTTAQGFTWPDVKDETKPTTLQNTPKVTTEIDESWSTSENSVTGQIFTSATLEDRIKESSTQKPTNIQTSVRPSFHPHPGNNVGQIIPPGKPWPNKPNNENEIATTTAGNLLDRIKELLAATQRPCSSPLEKNPSKSSENDKWETETSSSTESKPNLQETQDIYTSGFDSLGAEFPQKRFFTKEGYVYGRVTVGKWAPFAPLPFNLLPSHHVFYI